MAQDRALAAFMDPQVSAMPKLPVWKDTPGHRWMVFAIELKHTLGFPGVTHVIISGIMVLKIVGEAL
jgi:hypothetical protein